MEPEMIEKRVGRRVLLRLVLPSALFILMGAVDRANVSFAAIQMNAALGFSATQYGFGAGVLFAGYILSKIPSVMLYERIGMRRWLALITFLWGLAATAMAFIHTHTEFYVLRFLAGAAEGGLSSGLMIYLSHWATERYRASILAIPIVAISVSQVLGAPVSGLLLQSTNPLGWEGWRWMFLVEGLPSVALVVVAWLAFVDRPRDARWLNAEEADWLERNVRGSGRRTPGGPGRWSALRTPSLWLFALLWFCILAGNYGVIFWLPLVLHGISGLNPLEVGVVVALPWLGSGIGLLLNAWHSDRTQERFLHVALPAALGGLALAGAFLAGPGAGGLLLLIVGGACMGCIVSPFWAVPTRELPPEGLAMGIVTINLVGSMAGLIVPPVMGMLKDRTGSFAAPIFLIAGLLVLGAALALVARAQARR